MTPRDCANALWGFAVGQVGSASLFDNLSRDFLARAADPFSAEDPTGFSWLLASPKRNLFGMEG